MSKPALQRGRLKKLSKHLKSLPEDDETQGFDMNHWIRVGAPEVKGKPKIQYKNGKVCAVVAPEDNFCKTSACVLGHAALISAFNKLGLRVMLYNQYRLTPGSDEQAQGDVVLSKGGHKYMGVTAGEKFFGLTEGEAYALFHGDWTTPKLAAKVIDTFLAGKIKEKNQRFFDKKDFIDGGDQLEVDAESFRP